MPVGVVPPRPSLFSWKPEEIYPRGIILSSCDSDGDHLLFWHQADWCDFPKPSQGVARPDSNPLSVSHFYNCSVTHEPSLGLTALAAVGLSSATQAQNNRLEAIDEVPILSGLENSFILSLLHPKFSASQKPLNLKVDNRVFVGYSFNLSPTDVEPGKTCSCPCNDSENPCPTCLPDSKCFRPDGSVSRFSVAFVFDQHAGPTLRMSYCELAKNVGIQLRRAELFLGYLSNEQSLILNIIDQFSYSREKTNVAKSNVNESPSCYGEESPEYQANNSCSFEEPPSKDVNLSQYLADKSGLCHTLQTIFESASYTGYVNVLVSIIYHDVPVQVSWSRDSGEVKPQINQLYEVFFIIPHRVYCIDSGEERHADPKSKCRNSEVYSVELANEKGLERRGRSSFKFNVVGPILGIKPSVVWHALDSLRPYHSILLIRPVEQIIDKYLPSDVNSSLIEFMRNIDPTKSLMEMTASFNSQDQCLRIASWLIFRGHAIIIGKIDPGNVYSLSPASKHWMNPSMVLEFAHQFPTVNLAETLSSFSAALSLEEHRQMYKDNARLKGPELYFSRDDPCETPLTPSAHSINELSLLDKLHVIAEKQDPLSKSQSLSTLNEDEVSTPVTVRKLQSQLGINRDEEASEGAQMDGHKVAQLCSWQALHWNQIVVIIAWLLQKRLLVQKHLTFYPLLCRDKLARLNSMNRKLSLPVSLAQE
ncbi:Nitrogen permease regulator-like 3 [Cichlidogyrus casuarinus]|uniref:GATOR complex protein NPRL3 n=1 Tax=Cichlidogyrus casuarinus TaxID=1844966 RepID=A0ABD2PZ54_9PLAT